MFYLNTAIRSSNLEEVKRLLSEGATKYEKNEALRISCVLGHLEIVKLLIENGANVHGHSNYDEPLSCAIYYNKTEIITYLKNMMLLEKINDV
jgi:ankyrin repeat protein